MSFIFLQGTNQQQDTRFSDKEKKLLKQMKFGDCLNQRVCNFILFCFEHFVLMITATVICLQKKNAKQNSFTML